MLNATTLSGFKGDPLRIPRHLQRKRVHVPRSGEMARTPRWVRAILRPVRPDPRPASARPSLQQEEGEAWRFGPTGHSRRDAGSGRAEVTISRSALRARSMVHRWVQAVSFLPQGSDISQLGIGWAMLHNR